MANMEMHIDAITSGDFDLIVVGAVIIGGL